MFVYISAYFHLLNVVLVEINLVIHDLSIYVIVWDNNWTVIHHNAAFLNVIIISNSQKINLTLGRLTLSEHAFSLLNAM